MQPYIPPTDSGFRDFLTNFSNLINDDPARFGVTEADATVIKNHQQGYEAAYLPCQSAETRTGALVQHKDAVKAAAVASIRVYAMLIKNNAGVSNQDKKALGLHVNDTTPTPIPVPDSAPLLSIIAAFSGEHIITYADENSPHLKRKPAGVKQIQIYRHVAPGAKTLPEGGEEVGLFTRAPIKVAQSPSDVAMTATYFGRWVNPKGEKGPWSLPVCMTIAFGGPVDQQMWTPGSPDGGQPKQAGGEDDLKIAA
ncbi:MAG: hypothetical protein EA377_01155 [Phycisphaerales bacterium]|nr:MAG: hypothetical protein EA377_01155 [Phycisphaerales bacterium]